MVDEAEMWEKILANPLDPPPPYTIPLLNEVEAHFNSPKNNYAILDFDHSQDKPRREGILGELISTGPTASRKRRISISNNNYAMVFDHFQDKPRRDQYLEEFISKENWGSRGPRASRTRRIHTLNNNYAMVFDHLQDKPRRDQYLEELISKENWNSRGPRASRKRRIYTLNRRKWDQQAVIKLVEGAKKYGLGQWPEVKHHFFFPSFREPELFREQKQLKDKWRNLLIACKVLLNSKGKEQMEMYDPLDSWLIRRIRRLAKKLRLGIYK